MGYAQPRSLGSHESPGRLAAPVWADFMRRVLPQVPAETVPIPEGVFTASVNWRTGLQTEPEDPEAITEFFIRGEVATTEAPSPEESAPAATPPVEPAPLPPPVPQPVVPLP